ncbi:MAG: sigma-70 family RNA polymerase sigma factor [Deltaproteobacteria bacterium]
MEVEVEDWYRRFGPMVLRRCRRLLADEEQAVDAMHDVFVQLLRNEDRLDGSAPSSLLFRMATNVCLNKIRTKKRHPEDKQAELLDALAALDDPEARTGAARFLSNLFGREQPSTATIAVLHLLDGMTHEEVAEVVGLSVSGVRKRLRVLRANALTLAALEAREERA